MGNARGSASGLRKGLPPLTLCAIALCALAYYARVFIHEVCISTDSRIKKAHWEFQTSTVGSFIIYAFSTDRKNAFVRWFCGSSNTCVGVPSSMM